MATNIIENPTDFPTNPVHGDYFESHVWLDGYGWEYDEFVTRDEDGRACLNQKAIADAEVTEAEYQLERAENSAGSGCYTSEEWEELHARLASARRFAAAATD